MDRLSEEEIINVLKNHAQYTEARVINANTRKEYKVSEAIQGILDLYNKEKEKNKKVKKFCKEKSTFQTFGDENMQYVLETYINRLKHRILDLLED